MTTENEKPKDQKEPETEPSLDDLLKDLPIPQKYKKLVTGLVGGLVSGMAQVNERLTALENKPAADLPGAFDGLSSDQRYNILMARASAPAAQAQMQLYQGFLGALKGDSGRGGGGVDELIRSADKLKNLKELLMPEPTALQIAMEKAQIQQSIAQTRLMNKIVGKTSMDYLDKLEQSVLGGSPEE